MPKELLRQFLEPREVVVIDIVLLALREAVDEHRPSACPIDDDHAEPTGTSLPLSRQSLFDDAIAKIGINQTSLRACNGLAEFVVLDALTASEPCKASRLVNLHAKPLRSNV